MGVAKHTRADPCLNNAPKLESNSRRRSFIMSKRLLSIAGSVALAFASAAVASAQDTKTTTTTTTQVTKTTQNPDGTYTIVQYPVDKEVTVELTPAQTLTGARGLAKVMRHGDMTTITLDVSSLPADTNN